MADRTIVPQTVVRTGLAPAYTGSLLTADTHLVVNNGRTFLHFKKTGATDCVVTIQSVPTVDGLAVADLTVTVPATTGDRMIGPFPREWYSTAAGNISFTVSNITGLTVAALRF